MSAARSLDWLPDDLVISGLDRQATVQLAMLMETAAAEGARAALCDRERTVCAAHLAQVADIAERQEHDREALYGTPDSPSGGIVGRLRDLESRMKLLLWLVGTSAGAAISAVIALAITLARGG